ALPTELRPRYISAPAGPRIGSTRSYLAGSGHVKRRREHSAWSEGGSGGNEEEARGQRQAGGQVRQAGGQGRRQGEEGRGRRRAAGGEAAQAHPRPADPDQQSVHQEAPPGSSRD